MALERIDRTSLDDARQQSKLGERSSQTSPIDEMAERTRLFTKMFTVWPVSGGQDLKGAILAYIEETRDLPAHWLSCGLSALVREAGRKFAPSVGEIRDATLLAIRRARRLSQGLGPDDYNPQGPAPLSEARELVWAREKALALQSGSETKTREETRAPEPRQLRSGP